MNYFLEIIESVSQDVQGVGNDSRPDEMYFTFRSFLPSLSILLSTLTCASLSLGWFLLGCIVVRFTPNRLLLPLAVHF